MSSERVSTKSLRLPPLKKGWMRKKARKGLFKNWKTRFFVLHNGRLTYYRKEISEHPFGYNEKGVLNLYRTELVEEHSKVINDRQIFIVSFNGENHLLMEATTVAEANEWRQAIQAHIQFYNNHFSETG